VPNHQAWIESLFGHIKTRWLHSEKIRDPCTLVAALDRVRLEYNRTRLHAGIGYVTPMTSTKDEVTRYGKPT
jgi:transposase InsO family protein